MRAVIIAVLSGLLVLATLQPAAADDDYTSPPPFSVSLDGVQVDGPVGDPPRMWYGLRSLDGQSERTYSAKLPDDGGFVGFGGAGQYPGGYCVTWVTVQWKYRGFHSNPLCSSATTAPAPAPEAPQASLPEQEATSQTPSPEPTVPEPATSTPEPSETATSASAEPTEIPTEDPTDDPTDEVTEDPAAEEATTPASELPGGTTLVSSGADLGEVYAQRSADASVAAATSLPEPSTPMSLIVAASIGILAVSTGSAIVLARLLRDPRPHS